MQHDNEEKSAILFEDFATEVGLSAADTSTVAGWIRRTARHMDGPADGDLAAFLDADLEVTINSVPPRSRQLLWKQTLQCFSCVPVVRRSWDERQASTGATLKLCGENTRMSRLLISRLAEGISCKSFSVADPDA
eukprot:SAG31_NODE_7396_length_1698_cov_1.269663_1_plen_135_part_00